MAPPPRGPSGATGFAAVARVWAEAEACADSFTSNLDVAGLRRLAESIGRFLDRGEAGPVAQPAPDGLRRLGSRPMGAGWLLDGLWSRLGFAEAIGTAIAGRRVDPGVERVLFALVANRAIAPCSKLAALEWAAADVHLPGVGDLGGDPQVFYRAMDLLVAPRRRDPGTGVLHRRRAALPGPRRAAVRHHQHHLLRNLR